MGGCSAVVVIGDDSFERSETVEKYVEVGVTMEGVDAWVMVVEVWVVIIGGRVAGIEDGDRVGKFILCKPRTEVGEAI